MVLARYEKSRRLPIRRKACAGEEPIEAVAGGFPGVVADGVIYFAPNLPAWKGVALAAELSRVVGAPAKVHNDADLAALGEAVSGAGKGFRVVVYAGIGTALVILFVVFLAGSIILLGAEFGRAAMRGDETAQQGTQVVEEGEVAGLPG